MKLLMSLFGILSKYFELKTTLRLTHIVLLRYTCISISSMYPFEAIVRHFAV